jgi:predicted site-specific integrase-resolvase
MTPSNLGALYNKKRAAEILGISTATLDRLRQSGLLPYRKIGCQIRFLPEDIQIYLDRSLSTTRAVKVKQV